MSPVEPHSTNGGLLTRAALRRNLEGHTPVIVTIIIVILVIIGALAVLRAVLGRRRL